MLLWQIFLNGGRDLKYLRKMSTLLFGLWLAKKKKQYKNVRCYEQEFDFW